jgi:invasion protein IalB
MKAASLSLRSTFSILAVTAGLGLAAMDANAQAPAAQPGARPPQARPAQGQPAPAAQPAQGQPAAGQPAAGQPAPAAQQEANATVSGWVTRCLSQGRKANAECIVEQSLTMIRTNQVATIVHFRIPAEGQQPQLSVRVPHGVLLSAGVKLRVDQAFTVDLPIQTCENQGCTATAPAPAELVNAMRGGKQLFVIIKGGNNQDAGFGMPLDGFPAAFDRVR